jgi:hypothetical protein
MEFPFRLKRLLLALPALREPRLQPRRREIEKGAQF